MMNRLPAPGSPKRKGVRAVAIFEAGKGLLTVLAGLGVLSLLHVDVQAWAERLVAHLHLNPASHYPRIFIDLAANLTDRRLWMFAAFAFLYAGIRFIEACGLWNHCVWAEWFAAISGGIYIPFELIEISEGMSILRLSALFINILIVGYMVQVLRSRYPQRD